MLKLTFLWQRIGQICINVQIPGLQKIDVECLLWKSTIFAIQFLIRISFPSEYPIFEKIPLLIVLKYQHRLLNLSEIIYANKVYIRSHALKELEIGL